MNLNMSAATRWGFNLLILLALILGLYVGRAVFIPMVLALLFTAMLWPVVGWMHNPGLPVIGVKLRGRFPWVLPWSGRLRFAWSVASLIVVTLGVLLVLLVVTGFLIMGSKFVIDASNEPKLKAVYGQFRHKLIEISPWAIEDNSQYLPHDPDASGLYQKIKIIVNDPQFLSTIVGVSASFSWQCILVTFILLFMLIEGPMLNRHLTEIFGPSPPVRERVAEALRDMGNQIRVYIFWRTLINIAMALILGVLYYALGLAQYTTWALLSGVLLYIPYLGPILAGIGPTLDAFVTCPTAWYAIAIVAFYTAFIVLEGYLIIPVFMGRGMELNATTVMLACLFWEQVWHMAGLFLAMPLMAVVRTVCVHVPGWSPWANLMGTGEDDEPSDDIENGKNTEDYGFLEDTLLTQSAEADERFHDGSGIHKRLHEE